MSSIDRHIKLIIKNDYAVYWGTPTSFNSNGTANYPAPVEINCYWEEKFQKIIDDTGKEIISKAQILIDQDLANKGMVYHGRLIDLTTEQKNDPKKIHKAYEIKISQKVASLHLSNNYGRKIML